MKAIISLLTVLPFLTLAIEEIRSYHGYYGLNSPNEDCSNFNGHVGCRNGTQTRYPDDWSQRAFQTFLKEGPDAHMYKPEYEGLGRIMCYNKVTYTGDRKSATIQAVCRKHESIEDVQYNWNGEFTKEDTFHVDSGFKGDLSLQVKAVDHTGKTFQITVEKTNFVWQAPVVNQPDNYKKGQKGAIVELFGWPYADVKEECPFLAKAGYLGVKVYPPQESVFSNAWPQNGELNPWYFMYQPISYKLHGRSGSREELKDMIYTCRAAGVRVYADAVVNHMSGGGNDVWESHRNGNGGYCAHWGAKESTGKSPYFTQDFMYQTSNNTGQEPGMEYPNAQYIATDFHCERSLNSWTDPFILNNGWLVGLSDLDTESEYVRERIAAYMTQLLGIGFSGFRMDAAKHIYPGSIAAILKKFKNNMGGGELPDDFITYLEVILGGEMRMLMCDDNVYNFGKSFADKMKAAGLSDQDIYKVKIWESAYPKEFPECGSWQIPSERFVAQNDCHDDQNPGSSSRDMGDTGSVLVKERNVDKHRDFEKRLFTRTDGNWQIKAVLSSYSFMNDGAQGFPDGKSDCSKCVGSQCNTCNKSVPYKKAFDANSCGYDCGSGGSWKENTYTRVHRDQQIINAMRGWMGLQQHEDPVELGLAEHCRS